MTGLPTVPMEGRAQERRRVITPAGEPDVITGSAGAWPT